MSSQEIHDLFKMELNEDKLRGKLQESLRDKKNLGAMFDHHHELASIFPCLYEDIEQSRCSDETGLDEARELAEAVLGRPSLHNEEESRKADNLNWIQCTVAWRLVRGQLLRTALQRRALERGQNHVDLTQEPTGNIFTTYLDLEPTRETFMVDLREQPKQGAYLELLNYSLSIETLLDSAEIRQGYRYPASLLKAKSLEALSWRFAWEYSLAGLNLPVFKLNEWTRDHIFQHDLTFQAFQLSHKHIGQVDCFDDSPHIILANLFWHFHRYFCLKATSEAKQFTGTGTREVEYREIPSKLPELMSGTLKVTPGGSPLIFDPVSSQLPN